MNIAVYKDETRNKGIQTVSSSVLFFSYSINWVLTLLQRTHLFMAAAILINPKTEHQPHHDFESALYALTYICGMFDGPRNQQRKDPIPSFLNDWMQYHDRSPSEMGFAKKDGSVRMSQ